MKSVLRSGMSMFVLAGMLFAANPSQALMVDVTASAGDSVIDPILAAKGPGLTLTFTGLPTMAISDALVTLKVRGDFNNDKEYIDMSVDGVCCDRWLDGNNANDGINGPSNDMGHAYGDIIMGTRIIPLLDLLGLLADGELAFTFGYQVGVDPTVGNDQTGDFASVQVQYDYKVVMNNPNPTPTPNPNPVPEPSTMLLLGTGLVGMVAWRMKNAQP